MLIATDAQETRDMIRILANLYKSRGRPPRAHRCRLSTGRRCFRYWCAAFGLNEHHRSLRSKAQQNIISVTEAVPNPCQSVAAPTGKFWARCGLRSIAVGNLAGCPSLPRCRPTSHATTQLMTMLSSRTRDNRREQLQHPPGWSAFGIPRGRESAGQTDGVRAQRQALLGRF